MANVVHHPNENCFRLLPDGYESSQQPAILKYEMLSEKEVDFTSTFVPPALRNQGLAEALVREGLQWARQQHFTIVASCWYVDKFLKLGRHTQ